jgi:hypothetical protein
MPINIKNSSKTAPIADGRDLLVGIRTKRVTVSKKPNIDDDESNKGPKLMPGHESNMVDPREGDVRVDNYFSAAYHSEPFGKMVPRKNKKLKQTLKSSLKVIEVRPEAWCNKRKAAHDKRILQAVKTKQNRDFTKLRQGEYFVEEEQWEVFQPLQPVRDNYEYARLMTTHSSHIPYEELCSKPLHIEMTGLSPKEFTTQLVDKHFASEIIDQEEPLKWMEIRERWMEQLRAVAQPYRDAEEIRQQKIKNIKKRKRERKKQRERENRQKNRDLERKDKTQKKDQDIHDKELDDEEDEEEDEEEDDEEENSELWSNDELTIDSSDSSDDDTNTNDISTRPTNKLIKQKTIEEEREQALSYERDRVHFLRLAVATRKAAGKTQYRI